MKAGMRIYLQARKAIKANFEKEVLPMLTEYNDIRIKELLNKKQTVVALGNFDGVHLAHRFLICEAVRRAKENGLTSVVYTFDKHPKSFLGSAVEYITDNEEKAKLVDAAGADILYFQKTDIDFLKLSPYDFAKKVLKDTLNIKLAVIGEHYTFGAGGMGDAKKLTELGKELGFDVMVLPLIKKDGLLVSSTNIRENLSKGNIKTANALLGRCFSVNGRVESGNRIGTSIGFPTLNIYPAQSQLLPAFGVYEATAQLCGKEYKAILNVGVKPTVGSDRTVIEVHLLDASGDFYGEEVRVSFNSFIRYEKKFENNT